MLLGTPELAADDRRVLAEIGAMREQLRLHLRASPHWTGQLRRELFAGEVQGSNAIERITVTMSDARAAVEGQTMSPAVPPQIRAAILGYRDAMTYVQQTPQMPFFRYDEMLLSALHFMIQKYDLDKWPGCYRGGPIYITSNRAYEPAYTGPDAKLVPGLMRELVEWLNEGDLDQPALVRASMAHLNLVSIHPWWDGNGRMSRCLHTLVLARDGELAPEFSSIEEWLGDPIHTVEYYQALNTKGRTYQPETADSHPWLRFALTAHHRQAQVVQRYVDYTIQVWRDMEALAVEHDLHPRVVSALWGAAVGEVRRTTYQHDEGLTRDQAIRDLQALVRHGLVKPQGNAATRVYVADGPVREAHQATLDAVRKEPMRDPYPVSR